MACLGRSNADFKKEANRRTTDHEKERSREGTRGEHYSSHTPYGKSFFYGADQQINRQIKGKKGRSDCIPARCSVRRKKGSSLTRKGGKTRNLPTRVPPWNRREGGSVLAPVWSGSMGQKTKGRIRKKRGERASSHPCPFACMHDVEKKRNEALNYLRGERRGEDKEGKPRGKREGKR